MKIISNLSNSFISKQSHYFLIGFQFIAYLPSVVYTFAWSDDYPTILNPDEHALHALRDGRPLYSVLLKALFYPMNDISDARWAHLINIILIMFFTLIASQFLIRHLVSHSKLIIVAAMTMSLCVPSWQSLVYSAVGTGVILAAITGLIAMLASYNHRPLLSIGLFVFSLGLYPLFTFSFIPIICIIYLFSPNNFNFKSMLLFPLLYLLISAMVFLIALYSLFLILDVNPNPRFSVVSKDMFLIQFFFVLTRHFVLSFMPFQILSESPYSFIFSVLVIICAVLICIRLKIELTVTRLICCGAGVVLSLAPIIFANQQQIELRMIACSGLFFSFTLFALILESSRNLWNMNERLQTLSLILFVWSILSMNFGWQLIVKPQMSKNHFLKESLSYCRDSSEITLVSRKSEWGGLKRIGIFSQKTDLASAWVPLPNIILVGREIDIQITEIALTKSKSQNPGCFIDLNDFSP